MPQVRRAGSQDAVAIAGLLAELGYPSDPVTVRRRLQPLLARDDGVVLVAEEQEEVVGIGSLYLLPLLHEDAPRAIITALVVSERARRRGAGRAIVDQLEAFARARGCRRIIVTTANHRADAHRFYETGGYAWTGRRYGKDFPVDSAGAGPEGAEDGD
jgi:GNAT superfamily N-acetyltransferase